MNHPVFHSCLGLEVTPGLQSLSPLTSVEVPFKTQTLRRVLLCGSQLAVVEQGVKPKPWETSGYDPT